MNSYPEIFHYLGRYHVLLLHLPIGFIAIAFLMEITEKVKKSNRYEAAILFILFWSAIITVMTSVSGYFLSFEGGYENNLIDRHFWLGLATTVLTIVVYWLKKSKPLSKIVFPSFIGLMVLLLFTGHIGGSLTHGVDHLTTYRPVFTKLNRAQNNAPLLTGATEVFTGIVQPIFQEKCTQCHNENKLKGGLLLTSVESLQKGGDNGAFLKAGHIEQSLFLQRVKLPLKEKEHMPPRGKNQLTDEEIILLEWWVEEGASFNITLDSINKPSHIQSIIDKKNLRPKGVFALDIPPPNAQKIKELNDDGIRIWRLAQGSPLLQVDLSNKKDLTKKTLNALSAFSKQITDIDLGHSNIDDKAMSELARLPHLSRLHLEDTKVSDDGLKHLSNLKYLEYLNLYKTEVTDKGLSHLTKIKTLETLYLWQTKTSPEGIQKLKAALPKLNITTQSGDDVFAEVKLNMPQVVVLGKSYLFEDTLGFKLKSSFKGSNIYYTLDGSKPDEKAILFKDSVLLDKSADLRAVAAKEGWTNSDVLEKEFVKVGRSAQKVSWNKAPSPKYPGAGPKSLSDLRRGGGFVSSPAWVGWQGSHVTAVLDFGEAFEMQQIRVGFMENTNAWVFAPKGLKVWLSKDGKKYKNIISEQYPTREDPSGVDLRFQSHRFDPEEARFVKVKVESTMKNPEWHLAPGKDCWLFLDEIIVE